MRMENPMYGSLNRERTILIFQQRALEVQAAKIAMIIGGVMLALGIMTDGLSLMFIQATKLWLTLFGFLFFLAGAWAFSLFRIVKFDLKRDLYQEKYGFGIMSSNLKGSTRDFKCLEMVAYKGLFPNVGKPDGVVFVVRLWWNDPHRQPMVLEHLISNLSYSAVNDQATASYLQVAQRYSQILKLPLYGNLQPQAWNPFQ